MAEYILVYKTKKEVEILLSKGTKSEYDFIVRYREPGKRVRTPKHIHLIIDLYLKQSGNYDLTMKLVEHIIKMIQSISPSTKYPPKLQQYTKKDVLKFTKLDEYGEYPIEFLLVITELIMIQEKTNYPTGTMNLNIFKKFREGGDIFSIVSTATFR